MLMTSVTGHLMELDFDDQYRKWHSCQPVQLYDLPVHKKVPQVRPSVPQITNLLDFVLMTLSNLELVCSLLST